MSTRALAVIFVLLLMLAGFLFLGKNTTQAPSEHMMPDGSVMENTDASMNSTHVMPDGTMMHN